jgi:hypothetical protein
VAIFLCPMGWRPRILLVIDLIFGSPGVVAASQSRLLVPSFLLLRDRPQLGKIGIFLVTIQCLVVRVDFLIRRVCFHHWKDNTVS